MYRIRCFEGRWFYRMDSWFRREREGGWVCRVLFFERMRVFVTLVIRFVWEYRDGFVEGFLGTEGYRRVDFEGLFEFWDLKLVL